MKICDIGTGQCVHCRQAISGEEIKAQARGESLHGRWTDRLYCVVAVRLEPLLDQHGKPQRYTSGPNRGEIKTRKVRFFRPPNKHDLQALTDSETQLQELWPVWEAEGLIPNEEIPSKSNSEGHKSLQTTGDEGKAAVARFRILELHLERWLSHPHLSQTL